MKFTALYPALFLCAATGSTALAQAPGDVVINEFVSKNVDTLGTGYEEATGDFGDWIEFYNNTNAAVDLSGLNLSDDYGALDKWAFPAGSSIAANGYLIVWADDDDEPEKMQEGIHTSWKLGGSEEIALSRNGAILDSIRYFSTETNVARARVPNGTGNFVQQAPTPLASNETSGVRDVPAVSLRAYPSPATDQLTVELGKAAFTNYEVYDVRGARVAAGEVTRGSTNLTLRVADYQPGMYVLVLDGGVATASFSRSE